VPAYGILANLDPGKNTPTKKTWLGLFTNYMLLHTAMYMSSMLSQTQIRTPRRVPTILYMNSVM